MANIFDNDILITSGEGEVFLDLVCGYGQPSVSTVYLKKNDGNTEELKAFDNNATELMIGSVAGLRYNTIEIHTTIHDIRDSKSEKEDISLDVVIYDSSDNKVDTSITKKTKGKGHVFNSYYSVTIV